MYEQDAVQKDAAADMMAFQVLGKIAQADSNMAYRPSAREEAEKASSYHAELAQKASQAADFLRENPAFNEFVRLLRSGAIQLH